MLVLYATKMEMIFLLKEPVIMVSLRKNIL